MLSQLVRSFLEASGYVNIEERHGGLRAELSAPGGLIPFYFWPMPEAPDDRRRNWPAVLAMQRIQAARQEEPTAQLNFIRDEKPIPDEWSNKARDQLGVKIRYPVQFFDSNFAFESDDGASTTATLNATSKSLALSRNNKRVPQPYSVENSSESGPDLLKHLAREFLTPISQDDPESATQLHVVIGPAGAGKSVLFESLFAELYDKFISRKLGQYDARRPFQITPEHSALPVGGGSRGPGFDAIFSNYLSNEFTAEARRQAFIWRIQNGYGLLMLDGLDEVIATDEYFFNFLLDLFVAKESWEIPKVLICLRESMLGTNTYLQNFLEQISDDVPHRIYRLSKWDGASVNEFLRLFSPSDAISSRFRDIVAQPQLVSLTENPFYCRHLLDLVTASPDTFSVGATDPESAKSDLVESFIHDYIERDRKKGLIDPRISHESLLHVLELLATDNYSNGYAGVPTETIVALFDVILPKEVRQQEDLYNRQIDNLKRMAIFNKSSALNETEQHDSAQGLGFNQRNIHFVNDVIAEYLFSRHARDKVTRRTPSDLDQLATTLSAGPSLPSDGIVLRQIASSLIEEQVEALFANVANRINMTTQRRNSEIRNLLQLALMGARATGSSMALLQRYHVRLAGQRLQGMVFKDLDLRQIDFDGADLSNTVFDNCDLTEARLDARLHNTRFEGERSVQTLAHAEFGDLGRFQSVVVDDRSYDRDEFVRFRADLAEEVTQAEVPDFCPALEQLWTLVRRYKAPDGMGTRDWHIGQTILHRGPQHLADRQPLVSELIRRNYLRHDRRRDHYFIQDRAHQDFATFAQDRSALPEGLREVLDGVCNDNHIRIVG